MPPRNSGRFGREGDPLNLLFSGTEAAVRSALEASGWLKLSLSIPVALAQGLGQLARGRRLTLFPPMNIYKVLGRPQDHNWAIVVTPIIARHHFRLWNTGRSDPEGRPWWIGSANYDKDARYWDLSHVPDPDIDAERDYIAGTLRAAGAARSFAYAGNPRIPAEGANDKGYPFFTDRRVLVAQL